MKWEGLSKEEAAEWERLTALMREDHERRRPIYEASRAAYNRMEYARQEYRDAEKAWREKSDEFIRASEPFDRLAKQRNALIPMRVRFVRRLKSLVKRKGASA